MKDFFQLEKNRSTVAAELLAGLTAFLTMSYALAINPLIMQETGMPFAGVYAASAFAAGIASIGIGLFGNTPFVAGPAMGLNAFIAQTVCLKFGFKWQEALAIACAASLFHAILVAGRHGRAIVGACAPEYLKFAAAAGIGAFCTMGGFHYSGLLRHTRTEATNIAFDITDHSNALPPLIARFSQSKFIAILGIFIMIALLALEKKNKAAYAPFAIGIIAATFVGIPLGVTSIASLHPFDSSVMADFKSIAFAAFGDPGLLSLLSGPPERLLTAGLVCTVVCLIGFNDAVVSINALGRLDMNRVYSDEEIRDFAAQNRKPSRMHRSLVANALGAVLAPAIGCPPVTAYIECGTGIAGKGRTGLAAVTAGILFIASVPLAKLYYILPAEAVGAALILSGAVALTLVGNIDWRDFRQALPAGLTILFMIATNNFLGGIALGMLGHIVIQLVLREKPVDAVVLLHGLLLGGATLGLHLAEYGG